MKSLTVSLLTILSIALIGYGITSKVSDIIEANHVVEVAEIEAQAEVDVATVEWSHRERIAEVNANATKHGNAARVVESLGGRAIVLAGVVFSLFIVGVWSLVGGHGSIEGKF